MNYYLKNNEGNKSGCPQPIGIRVWKIAYPVLLYFIVMYLVVNSCALLLQTAGEAFWESYEYPLTAAINGIAMLATLPFLYRYFHEQTTSVSSRIPLQWQESVLLLLLAIGAAAVLNSIFAYLGITAQSEQYQQSAQIQYSVPFWLGILLYVIISPLVEEVVFRGIVFGALRQTLHPAAAVLLSALLFGLYHRNAVQGVYAFLVGSLLAVCYNYYRDFRVPVALHAAANLYAYLMTCSPTLGQAAQSLCYALGSLIFTMVVGGILCYNLKHKQPKM